MIPSEFRGAYAIGSGSDFAMGAMLAGKTAAESVRIATKLDIYSGGAVRSIAV
jgi:ATP-dependent protease HslVU (ClpYQ) peptidase subunit